MNILIIFTICYVLYKAGFAKSLLKAATLQPAKPYKKEYQKKPIKPPATNKTIIVYESRTQLEARAANILTAAGNTSDVWQKVRTLTNQELDEIITNGY